MTEDLILVNESNRAIGRAEKYAVHATGQLHRAFSVFLVDAEGRVLIQRRQRTKYHSGGLWANSCCGHPRPGERTLAEAQRRLGEELGTITPLRLSFMARYRAAFQNGLQENEIVHVYFGVIPTALQPDPAEIMAVRRRTLTELQRDVTARPDNYAVWLKHYLKHHRAALRSGVSRITRGTSQSNAHRAFGSAHA